MKQLQVKMLRIYLALCIYLIHTFPPISSWYN